MKGDAQPLIKFFDGSDKRFIIPLYQRNYDWKEENCEQLFQDLMKLHNSDRKSHFFGSIVSSIQPGTEDRFIIDGQQRITTVSLLLIAMVNAKKEGVIEATDAKLVEKIFKRYLVDEYHGGIPLSMVKAATYIESFIRNKIDLFDFKSDKEQETFINKLKDGHHILNELLDKMVNSEHTMTKSDLIVFLYFKADIIKWLYKMTLNRL